MFKYVVAVILAQIVIPSLCFAQSFEVKPQDTRIGGACDSQSNISSSVGPSYVRIDSPSGAMIPRVNDYSLGSWNVCMDTLRTYTLMRDQAEETGRYLVVELVDTLGFSLRLGRKMDQSNLSTPSYQPRSTGTETVR